MGKTRQKGLILFIYENLPYLHEINTLSIHIQGKMFAFVTVFALRSPGEVISLNVGRVIGKACLDLLYRNVYTIEKLQDHIPPFTEGAADYSAYWWR